VWVRIDRVKKPLEAPYSGPFDVVERRDSFFVVRYPSGKCDTVSINRLKPFYSTATVHDTRGRRENLVKRLKAETEENLPDPVDSDDSAPSSKDEDETPALPNHQKFANRIPFQTRSGRMVKFAATNQVRLIPQEGQSRPVPKRF